MLRNKIGDKNFRKGLRDHYAKYQHQSILTEDFQKSMEHASGQKLDKFFQQWIYSPGHPQLAYSWEWKKGKLSITIDQKQKGNLFEFPLEVVSVNHKGIVGEIISLDVSLKSQKFEIPMEFEPEEIVLDPNVKLLYEKYVQD